MNPIDKIKSGIQKNNMILVSEGFEDLTGEKVIAEDEQEVVETEKEDAGDSFITSTRSSETSGKSRIARSEPLDITDRENTFVDDGTEASEDTAVDKKLAVKPPVERTRRIFKRISTTCVSCNKNFEIHPTLVRENYKCDNCITRR
jgi:hypothetical protein|tara:strand:- start:94 stop:531 length:438 start_codon:yes stop_codon:yes gene_type:complete